ncbi:hypothetical protein [Dactylosporangium darangshiense]|uniref:Uncharacterized protein n=1 Tax=Dactylosporangium darangshiense TaxID=579108 RepID=A0ABP8DRT2_9ACTN
MISALNRLVDLVEEHLTEELDVNGLARALGTTEYPRMADPESARGQSR